jgi:hypothetical protein
LIENVSSNDNSALKLTEDEEDDWHCLEPLGVQSEDYSKCDSALKDCGARSVDQALELHLTRPEEPEEEKEVAGHKATYLDALRD